MHGDKSCSVAHSLTRLHESSHQDLPIVIGTKRMTIQCSGEQTALGQEVLNQAFISEKVSTRQGSWGMQFPV